MVLKASGGHASGNKPSTERRFNSKGSHGSKQEQQQEAEIITEVVVVVVVVVAS